MAEQKYKIAVCQLRTELSQPETLDKAEEMVKKAAENGAQVICLPEMFNCPYSKSYFRKIAALGHEETVSKMSEWAKNNGIILIGGSIPETEDGKIYNTCFVFDENGRNIARHRKVHLFDVDIPGMRFAESHTFAPGSDITVFDTKLGKMGAAICFDVRFPEMFRAMAKRGAEIIFLPAQFNMKTGPAHWKQSIAMRALDNEVFFVGAAAARYDGFDYECWGHSAVIDPYGYAIAECDESEQILYAEIDPERIRAVRGQLPTFTRLREDVYSVAT